MHAFSIITPTYNRYDYVSRIYHCLEKQSGVDLEWIIVDDGSTDNTDKIVSSFSSSQNLDIKYIYQKNAGKPSAVNAGIRIADSYITQILDSDDVLLPDTLNKIWKYFNANDEHFENKCVCVSGLCVYENGKLIGDKFPKDNFVSNHIFCRENMNIKGDKCEFFLTKVIKEYLSPIITNERFIPEGIYLNRIAQKFNTIYINEVLSKKQFIEGGLSSQDIWLNNPLGTELYYNEATITDFKFSLQIKNSSEYIRYSKINHQQNTFDNAINKKAYPFGLVLYHWKKLKFVFKRIRAFNFFYYKIIKRFVFHKKDQNWKIIAPSLLK
jgi:glycosyltransferase involved in cell wall biosynthesis